VGGEFRLASARGGQAILAKPRRPALKEQTAKEKFSFPLKRKKCARLKIKNVEKIFLF